MTTPDGGREDLGRGAIGSTDSSRSDAILTTLDHKTGNPSSHHRIGHLGASRQDWRTPRWLFDQLNAEFRFTLDAAASEENALCDRYFTEEDDALVQSWVNPCDILKPQGVTVNQGSCRCRCHQSDARIVERANLERSNTLARIQKNEMDSTPGVVRVYENGHGRQCAGDEQIPSSEKRCSKQSEDIGSPNTGVRGSETPLESITTFGVNPKEDHSPSTGTSIYGMPVSVIGTGSARIADNSATVGGVMESIKSTSILSDINRSLELSPGTCSPHATSVTAEREVSTLSNGFRETNEHQRSLSTCKACSRGTAAVWINAPYKRLSPWVQKAYDESRKGATVVMLLPASTDTRWFYDIVQPYAEVRFIRGRLKFEGAAHPATFASMVVIFRPWKVSI